MTANTFTSYVHLTNTSPEILATTSVLLLVRHHHNCSNVLEKGDW
ncbi:MAG: hypothetical protein QM755_06370 [Luteolibacter sp.]